MKKLLFGLILILFVSCGRNSYDSNEVSEIASSLAGSGKTEQAITYLEEQAAKDSKNKGLYYSRIGYYYIELNQLDKAENYLKQAISENKKIGFAYNELAYLYAQQNKIDLSLENYLKGTEYEPGNGESFYGAGYVYYRKKDYDKAVKYLEKSIPKYKKVKKYDYVEDAYSLIVQCYYEQGNKTKMDEVIKKAEKEFKQMNKK